MYVRKRRYVQRTDIRFISVYCDASRTETQIEAEVRQAGRP